ncbi:thioredoxin [Patescibacteria group bacterium]|nr:thioredoxin [Patescibacteria group bacterium]MBU1160776.1 thioredoxin [Patescibacteria group bacterium]MBU1684051.1 thioredoxin [Patescibacteria group bacterium]MBU1778380.1 thioredoxin [Patescibacteria group bacterium]MBU1987640.1 thioredoxin [Patescibacteria group bacterium]
MFCRKLFNLKFIMKFTNQNFQQTIEKTNTLVLVDFFNQWCGPCKLMMPIIDELIEEYKDKSIVIGSLDIDESPEIAEKYDIMSIPTLILFKNGKILDQIVGYKDKEFLKDLIDKNL